MNKPKEVKHQSSEPQHPRNHHPHTTTLEENADNDTNTDTNDDNEAEPSLCDIL